MGIDFQSESFNLKAGWAAPKSKVQTRWTDPNHFFLVSIMNHDLNLEE